MHEMSQGSWISLLPFVRATPHHYYLAQQHEFVETLALAKRVHSKCFLCVLTGCIRKGRLYSAAVAQKASLLLKRASPAC